MSPADVTAVTILVSLVVYVLLGGADFGGGVWDLLARGPRAGRQREAVAHAIGPIWEANHVWMIVAVVLLFTAFPAAFALVMTALHVPVSLMLVGIVLRGSSFVFRKVDPAGEDAPSGWQRVFALTSLLTPVMLGVVLGTVSTPVLRVEDGVYAGGFFAPWLRPFPWAVGCLALALFSFLAATYLTVETSQEDPELAGDFRRRALAAAAAVAALAGVVAALALSAAPEVADHLASSAGGRAALAVGAASLAGAAAALWSERWAAARILAAATAATIVVGWGWGMHPWIVAGALTVEEAAAPVATQRAVHWILGAGTVVLVPAFVYLYRIFKGGVMLPPSKGPGRPPQGG